MRAGPKPCSFFAFSPRDRRSRSVRHTKQRSKVVESDQPVAVNDHAERENHARRDRRPTELAPESWDRWRTGVGAGRDYAALLLAAHAKRQHGEQHSPPDDEINR